ncbi:MAG TPA: DEAD/DEAH box helicase, partial [Polyangiales bacterium]
MAHDLGALEEAEFDAALGALDDVAPKAEVARMLRPHARLFSERLQIDRGEPLRPDYQELSAPVLELSFEYPGFVVRSSDPKERFFCADRSGMSTFARDAQAESRARHVLEGFGAIDLELLEDYGAAPGSRADYLVQIDEAQDARCAFTAYALPQLRALGWKIEIAEDYPYQVLNDEPPWYAVVEEDEQKPDWFSLELGIEIDGHRVNLLPVLLAMVEDGVKLDAKRASRLSPRFVQVPGLSRYVPVPAERLQILMQVMAELYHGLECDGETIVFPEVRAAALGRLEQAFAGEPERLRLTSHESIRERAKAFSAPPRQMARVHATSLQASLRPYQEAGLAWLQHLREHDASGVLADDMGLGKTVQLLALLRGDTPHESAPTLLVCPMSLVGNWQREAARFAPGLRVHVHHGAERPKGKAFHAVVAGSDLVVTTYGLVIRDVDALREMSWRRVVLDEAQAVKNAATRAATAVRSLPSSHRFAVTGTPV